MNDAQQYAKSIDQRTYNDLKKYQIFGRDQLNALSDFVTNKNPSNFIDPGYQFRLNAGSNAVANNAATSGMLQSGDTLRALTQYGQDMGSQEYGNAFNRWLNEGQFRQGLANTGLQAATAGGQVGTSTAANVGDIAYRTGAGNAMRPWADLAGMVGGFSLNQAAKIGPNYQMPNFFSSGGGSNIFAKGGFPSSVGVM